VRRLDDARGTARESGLSEGLRAGVGDRRARLALDLGARADARRVSLRALRVCESRRARHGDVPGILCDSHRARRAAPRCCGGLRRVVERERRDDALWHRAGSNCFRRRLRLAAGVVADRIHRLARAPGHLAADRLSLVEGPGTVVSMKTYRIAVIAGDGIGQEVIPAALSVLDAAARRAGFRFEWQHFPWGSQHYVDHGRMMPEDALDLLRPFDAILFGAVGDPRIQDNVTLNGLLLSIRRRFDQYACVRPAVLYPGVRSPLAGRNGGDIDFVVVRENTEGEYAQIGGGLPAGGPYKVAMQTPTFTRHGTERVIRFAFDLASRRNQKRLVTSVTKSNAQGFSMAFWDRVFAAVARDYPDMRTESLLVDAACMDLVRRPIDFDVIVASNLFGDILTDLSDAITGRLGIASRGYH